MGAGGQPNGLHTEGRGFESHAGAFPDFFCPVGVFAVQESIHVV